MGLIGPLVIILLGGIISGIFTAPLKYMKGRWQWENMWFIYVLYGLFLLPWVFVLFTVKEAFPIYQAARTQDLVLTLLFGFLWGCGSVCFGAGTDMVGNSLGFAIILGLTSALGSAIPLVALHPSEIGSQEGICTWIGLVIVAVGLYLLAVAGSRKEKEQGKLGDHTALLNADVQKPAAAKPSFKIGLIVCLISGVLSPMLNLALAFGDHITQAAKDSGAPDAMASNATWALGVGAGSIPNMLFVFYKLNKNGTWPAYKDSEHGLNNVLLGVSMGVMWFGGTVMYGVGANALGDLGTVLGWPLFMCSMIMSANVFAYFTGEWANTTRKTKNYLIGGLALLFLAIVVVAIGGVKL